MRRQEMPVNCSACSAPPAVEVALSVPCFFLPEPDPEPLLFFEDPDIGDSGDMRDRSASAIISAAWVSSILLRRHSSSYILISHMRLAQASAQHGPRLSFSTLFRFLP